MRKGLRTGLAVVALVAGRPSLAEIHATATVDTRATGVRIAPEIYGHFAEELGHGIDGGIWVGRKFAHSQH